MKAKIKWVLVVLGTTFVLLQFTSPAHTNPPVKNDFIKATVPPPEIAAIFHAACYDCHSHETRWPLYSRVAPISWSIANDVKEARAHLDLSQWPVDATRAARKLEQMSEEIRSGEMPLKKYSLIHPEARLTDSQRKVLADWLDTKAMQLNAP